MSNQAPVNPHLLDRLKQHEIDDLVIQSNELTLEIMAEPEVAIRRAYLARRASLEARIRELDGAQALMQRIIADEDGPVRIDPASLDDDCPAG